jgi:hypothetical protein
MTPLTGKNGALNKFLLYNKRSYTATLTAVVWYESSPPLSVILQIQVTDKRYCITLYTMQLPEDGNRTHSMRCDIQYYHGHDRPKALSNTVKVISNIPNISLWYCILSTNVHCICEILDYIFQYLLLLKCIFTELTTRYCNALQVWKCDCYRGIRLIQTFKYFGSGHTWWRLFQKRYVSSKLNIYVFHECTFDRQ